MLPMIAPWMIAQSANGQTPPRMGNRHPVNVPQNVFRCRGPDDFVLVSVTDSAMWQALCGVIGRGVWAGDPSLAHADGRRAFEAEIESATFSLATDALTM